MYENAGEIKKNYNQFDSARVYFEKSAEIFSRLKNPVKEVDVLSLIAKLDFAIGDYTTAHSNLEKVLQAIESGRVENIFIYENSLEMMALVEQKLGFFASGLTNALTAKSISYSLNLEETALKVALLETNFETQKRDNEILLLEYENQAANLRIVIITILSIGIILVITIIYWESIKRKAFQKNLEMKSLQKELEQYGILLNEKNSYLTKVVDRLNELNSDIKTTTGRKSLYNLIDSLKQNIATSESEELMFKKIEQVNTGFFRALRTRSQDLSSSEKRLASLVQMDLSSKDIANILHINPKSVNQAKYRLKKKLDVKPEIDLKEYLNSLVTE